MTDDDIPIIKHCNRCGKNFPETDEFWYVQRVREGHKVGWQAHCRECWKEINQANKKRIRQKK